MTETDLDFRLFESEGCWSIQALHAPGQPVIVAGYREIRDACEWLWTHVERFEQGED